MARAQVATVAVAVGALAVIAWLLSLGGTAKVSGQLKVAAGAGDDGPVTVGTGVRHGVVPGAWQPHIPRNAHPGPHRMYRHPRKCSPVLTAPAQFHYDWLYSPPSEGDL